MNTRLSAGIAGVLTGLVLMTGSADAQTHRGGKHRFHHVAASQNAENYSDNTFDGLSQRGVASYYGYGKLSRYTASGAVFDRTAMTAAHPWLPFGTRVLVTDETTGREVIVTITDRLPSRHRIIDLSVGAARELGILQRGVTRVSIEQMT